MLCQLSYRRIYRNEDGGEVFRSFLAPITSPIHIISQFPPKRTILKESGGILSSVAASVRLRGALVRFCGHDRVGDQVDRKDEQPRNNPGLETGYLTKIHSTLAPFAGFCGQQDSNLQHTGSRSPALYRLSYVRVGRPLWNCTRAPRIRMRRFCAASGRLPGADRLYNRKEAMERGRRGVGTIARRRPGTPVCLPHTRGRV